LKHLRRITLLAFIACTMPPAFADEAAELAKKLSNPVAALISVPIQANYDESIGANDQGSVWRTNIQPVIPVSIGDDWNLISRTILPVIQQHDIPTRGSGESGVGDVLQSFFFSPKTTDSERSYLGSWAGPAVRYGVGCCAR